MALTHQCGENKPVNRSQTVRQGRNYARAAGTGASPAHHRLSTAADMQTGGLPERDRSLQVGSKGA